MIAARIPQAAALPDEAGAGPAAERGELAALAAELARLEAGFAAWDDRARGAVAAYRRAIDALHAEALRRIVRACRTEPVALAVLRAVAADEVVYSVLRQLQIVKPSLDERIEAALAGVRPMLAAHGGGVELVRIAPPVVEVRLLGACHGCAASAMTLHAGVRQAVLDGCPEITDVTDVRGDRAGVDPAGPEPAGSALPMISPFGLDRRGSWTYACELGELVDRGVRPLTIAGTRVLLARSADRVTCFVDACAHLGLPLAGGAVAAGVLTCPHHGFRYELATGACLTAPAVALATHPARVTGTRVEVRLVP
jgi:nitrite reductase/ring-hydroxylating ferredoxin subunit/Fe-S cluster biogenesis protein NfuA